MHSKKWSIAKEIHKRSILLQVVLPQKSLIRAYGSIRAERIHDISIMQTYIFGSSMIGHQRERQLVALPLLTPLNPPVAEVPLGRRPVGSAASAAAAGGTGLAHADHRYRSNPNASLTYDHNITSDRSLCKFITRFTFTRALLFPFRAQLRFAGSWKKEEREGNADRADHTGEEKHGGGGMEREEWGKNLVT